MGNISGAPHEVLFSVMNALFTVEQNSAYLYKYFVYIWNNHLFHIYIFLNLIVIQKSMIYLFFVSKANF